jgi:hypothetical protein
MHPERNAARPFSRSVEHGSVRYGPSCWAMRPLFAPEVHARLFRAARLEGRVEPTRARGSIEVGEQDARFDLPIAGDHQAIAIRLARSNGGFTWPEREAADFPRVARVGDIQADPAVRKA